MYRMFVHEGRSEREIAEVLNAEGVVTPLAGRDAAAGDTVIEVTR